MSRWSIKTNKPKAIMSNSLGVVHRTPQPKLIWTHQDCALSIPIVRLLYCEDLDIIVGFAPEKRQPSAIISRDEGYTWEVHDFPDLGFGYGSSIGGDFCWSHERQEFLFVWGGGEDACTARSPNAINFTIGEFNSSSYLFNRGTRVEWSPKLNLYTAFDYGYQNTPSHRIYTSPTGANNTWTVRQSPFGDNDAFTGATLGRLVWDEMNEAYVAVLIGQYYQSGLSIDPRGKAIKSTDAINWSLLNMGDQNRETSWRDLKYQKLTDDTSKLFAVAPENNTVPGTRGQIYAESFDGGNSWTQYRSVSGVDEDDPQLIMAHRGWAGIAYGSIPNKYMVLDTYLNGAVPNKAVAYNSDPTDPTGWKYMSTPTTRTSYWHDIIYIPQYNKYVAGGANGGIMTTETIYI